MTQRHTRLYLATILLGALFTASAQIPPLPRAAGSDAASIVTNGDEPVTLNLPEGDINLILILIENYTGRVILRPPNLPTAKFYLKWDKPMPKSEALLAIETILNLNGIGLVPLGDKFIKVVPIQQVRYESPALISGPTLDLPPSGRVATKLFQLDFLRASEFIQQFATLFNPNFGTPPVPFEKSNAVMVTDSISTLQRIELLLQQIDHPKAIHDGLKFYNVKNVKASDLVTKLKSIMEGAIQQQMGTAISFSADDRTNQIILNADPRQHSFFDMMFEKLDVKADPNTRNEVIYLKNASSKDVTTLLSNIVAEKTKSASAEGKARPTTRPSQSPVQQQPSQGNPQGAPAETIAVAFGAASASAASHEFSGNVSIQSDERSNAIVVSGTVDDIRLIKELIDKIDIILAQVRIEVVIAQVTLSDEATSGIDSIGAIVEGDKLVGFRGATSGLAVSGIGQGPFALFSRASATVPVSGAWDLAGQIALASTPRKGSTTILSVPSITTTHNKEASFFSGQTRPTLSSLPTQSTTGGTIPGGVTQQEIGTTLKVKPLIGSDGTVQLDIEQEVSEAGAEVEIGENKQVTIIKQKNKSFVTVKSGEVLVLGGLQKNTNTKSSNRLGPIPIIGDLLGSRNRRNNRDELIFFLRPTVLTNTVADNAEAMKQVEAMKHHEQVKKALDPAYQSPEEKPAPALKRPR